MISTLLAWLLLWVLYLWLDRRRLLRMVNPSRPARKQVAISKPVPPRKTPSKPRFTNSARNSEAIRSGPPTASSPPSHAPQNQPGMNFDAISREAVRRQQESSKVSAITQNKLYRLTHGDVKMIDRLLIHTRSRNPDRPEQWIWEKVICDLERDRGYR